MSQIKSLVQLSNIDQIVHFDQASPDSIVTSYKCVPELAKVVASSLSAALKGSAVVITGCRGVGKSHLLAFIRSILANPALLSRLDLHESRCTIEPVLNQFTKKPLVFPLYFSVESQLPIVLRESREAIESLIAKGKPLAIFIDGVSRHLSNSEVIRWLDDLLQLAEVYIFIELYERDVVKHERLIYEVLGLEPLADVFDQFIAVKTHKQREMLKKLYEQICQQLPWFSSSRDEFIKLYPLHPQVLQLVPSLRGFSSRFSLFGFFYSVAPRALLKRDFNLISVIQLFEAFEFEFRRTDALAYLLSVYDKLNDRFVKALPQAQQLYAKIMLTSLTVLSLDGRARSIQEITDAAMLFEDGSHGLFEQMMSSHLELMAITAGDAMEVVEINSTPHYRLRLSEEVYDPLAEKISQISDSDERISQVLLQGAKHCFKDWPFAGRVDRVEADILWQGTARRGVISTANEETDMDWFIQIVPVHALAEEGEDEPLMPTISHKRCRLYWYPAELFPDELEILKRLIVLEESLELLSEQKIEAERQNLTAQVVRIFLRVYVEMGRYSDVLFKVRSKRFSRETRPFPTGSRRFLSILSNIFEHELETVFSAHPRFRAVLGERILKELIRLLFYSTEWNEPRNADIMRNFAEPLQLVKHDEIGWRFRRRSEIHSNTPLGFMLQEIEKNQERWIHRSSFEQNLREQPFGLQAPVALLLSIGASAAGLVILANEQGEIILSNVGLRQGFDVNSYTRIYDSELLKLYSQRTSEEVEDNTDSSIDFTGQLENLLHDAISDIVEPEQDFDEEPHFTSEDVLVEFYQTGFFTRNTGTHKKEEPPPEPVFDPELEPISQAVPAEDMPSIEPNYEGETPYFDISAAVASDKPVELPMLVPAATSVHKQTIAQRKVISERLSQADVEFLCREFFKACALHRGPEQMPSHDQLVELIFSSARRLIMEKRLKEVTCLVELENGVVHVNLQIGRASLFEEQSPKIRLL